MQKWSRNYASLLLIRLATWRPTNRVSLSPVQLWGIMCTLLWVVKRLSCSGSIFVIVFPPSQNRGYSENFVENNLMSDIHDRDIYLAAAQLISKLHVYHIEKTCICSGVTNSRRRCFSTLISPNRKYFGIPFWLSCRANCDNILIALWSRVNHNKLYSVHRIS